MKAHEYDFQIPQGSDHDFSFRFRDDESGDLADMSLATARMQLRRLKTSEIASDTLTTENGRLYYDDAERLFTAMWTHDVTERLGAGLYYYDIEIVYEDGRVERVLEGRIRVSQEVTR